MKLLIGKILSNRYKIIEKIGDGGMAYVYKGKCKLLNRYVAIKILKPEFAHDEDFLMKFKDEAKSAAILSHPNIVSIYDVGHEDGIDYIVMELVEGKTLKEYIKENGKLNYNDALFITKQIALALEQAHKKKIIHRDIKSHNILITTDKIIKVVDFGIAKAVSNATIVNGSTVMGSVHYLSPEQARGMYVDERSDLYSLGIILYEMLSGKLPFNGETAVNIAIKHISEDIDYSEISNLAVPSDIVLLTQKLTQRNQSQRYGSARELISDIELIEKNIKPAFDDEDFKTQKIDLSKLDLDDFSENLQIDDIEGDEMSDKRKRKKKSKKKITIFAIFSALIASIFFVFLIIGLKNKLIKEEYAIPNLVNVEYEQAKTTLEAKNLNISKRREVYSVEYEKGHIISQEPAEGTLLKEGSEIKVVVSKGKELVQVPDFVNKKLNGISKTLKDSRLQEGIVEYQYSNRPEGTILSQTPRAFSKIEELSEVNFVVSQGKEVKLITVPNLIGKTVEESKTVLKGLYIGDIKFKENKEKEEGVILKQSFAADSKAKENSKIDIVVNKYAQPVEEEQPTVPESPQEEAESKLVVKKLTIQIPTDKEVVNVKVEEKIGATSSIVYDSQVNVVQIDGTLSVSIKGENGQSKSYNIYIDGELSYSVPVEF